MESVAYLVGSLDSTTQPPSFHTSPNTSHTSHTLPHTSHTLPHTSHTLPHTSQTPTQICDTSPTPTQPRTSPIKSDTSSTFHTSSHTSHTIFASTSTPIAPSLQILPSTPHFPLDRPSPTSLIQLAPITPTRSLHTLLTASLPSPSHADLLELGPSPLAPPDNQPDDQDLAPPPPDHLLPAAFQPLEEGEEGEEGEVLEFEEEELERALEGMGNVGGVKHQVSSRSIPQLLRSMETTGATCVA